MLANPAEFHTMMYKAFWLGEMPKPKPGQKSGKPSGQAPPNAAVQAFEAERKRIMALQAEAAK